MKSALNNSRCELPSAVHEYALTAQRELQNATLIALRQCAEGALMGAQWFTDLLEEHAGRPSKTKHDHLLAQIAGEPRGPVQDLMNFGPKVMEIGRSANRAGDAAWKIRKWDVYERQLGAAQLNHTHPELVRAAEATCDAALALVVDSAASVRRIIADVEQLGSSMPKDSMCLDPPKAALLRQMTEMGFEESRARQALNATGWRSAEDAVAKLVG
eukprot:gnl/TRDRNA2_/TRDRNA2_140480_c1_seq2.p1 gnl/TRDRNA2_/TRDRNA2_140480_c1~~gnl/TRDRNA2_/TRDRNA2_140480_c1_seq2.p1  ORF type:complete len:241 (-),score=30.48 gnl/TRDRNA2_/TRDRNA2_140480_c1_seq2:95-739(-)